MRLRHLKGRETEMWEGVSEEATSRSVGTLLSFCCSEQNSDSNWLRLRQESIV